VGVAILQITIRNLGDEIENGVMARWIGRGAVELVEGTSYVPVVVDSFPATIHMIRRYAACASVAGHSRNAERRDPAARRVDPLDTVACHHCH
jgi:hypothetical protein